MFRGLYGRGEPKPVPPLVWLIAGGVLLFLGVAAIRSGMHNERYLSEHGIRADARLASVACGGQAVTRLSLARGSCSVYGMFTFQTTGGKQASTRIYLAAPSALKVGDTVPIEYNPHNPANAQLADGSGGSSNVAEGLGLVLIVIAGVFLIAAPLTYLGRRGDRKLPSAAEPEEGTT